MPVAERLYYADSFVQSFSATVTDIREVSRDGGESIWQLALSRTAFYPTSGGQPYDMGLLQATSRGGAALDVPVESVEEDDQGEIWHFVRKPLSAGTHVEARIDWDRRFDHMQQHTGQHLLSAIFLREFHAQTVSFHLGESLSTIDIASAPLAHHSLERVERIVNEIIGEDRLVSSRYVSGAEAEAMLAAGEMRKLPDRAGDIRLIEIAECDRSACGGTHVRSTGQIGGLLLRGTEKVSRGLRVEFVCGLRAVRAARADFSVLSQAGAALSVGAGDISDAIDRLKNEIKAAAKERQRLTEELADYHAARLAVEVPIEGGLRLVQRSWKDRDRDYIRLLGSRLASAAPSTVAILASEEALPVRVILARSADLHFHCGQIMKACMASIGLRGGGSADLAQGDVSPDQAAAMRNVLAEAVRKALTEARKGSPS